MARAAAADIAGSPAAYLPGPVATRLKVAGIDLFTMGELDGEDEVVALDTRAGHYRRDVYAAASSSARSSSATRRSPPRRPIRSSAPATASRAARSSTAAPPTSRACAGSTRASTGCGSCAGAVQALLDEAAEVGFQAVQVEGEKAIEVLVRRPVEVRGAGRQ